MISLRKALALIICLTLVCGCLASCEILDALGSGSQTKVDPDKYEATVRIVFASNDSKMKAALSAVSSTSTVRSSGSSLEVYTEGKGSDISVTDSYILTGGMLYLPVDSGVFTARYLALRTPLEFTEVGT